MFLGFPVAVEPWFWLSAALLGGALYNLKGPEGLIAVLLNMVVIFVSVLIHELGHALTIRKFGAPSEIVLHAMGGVCISRERYTSRWQNILISAAGPAAGFVLALVVFLIVQYLGGPIQQSAPLLYGAFFFALWVNIVWGIFNLLPVLPMDGGNILKEVMGPRRLRWTYLISGSVAVLVAIWALYSGLIFMAVMLGFFAYGSFRGSPTNAGGVQEGHLDPRYSQAREPMMRPERDQRPFSRDKSAKIIAFQPGGSVPQAEVDRILEKVASGGIGSLSREEKRLLEKHSSDLNKRSGR